MKNSIDLLSHDFNTFINELQQKSENIVLQNKFEAVIQLTLDSFIKPID
jgi:hypothetical protein